MEVESKAKDLAEFIKSTVSKADLMSGMKPKEINLYGIPRGGVPAAILVSKHLPKSNLVDHPTVADYFIDDLIDSGATMERWCDDYPGKPFLSLYNKKEENVSEWLIFPWEEKEESSAEDIPLRLMQFIGEDINRGGLLETPKRFLKAWKHFTSGYDKNPSDILKVFEDGAENYDEMVLVKNIPIYSQCEHHLVPFFGVAHIAYIPNGKVVGLSKLSRVTDVFSRRLQVQERLTNQIAECLEAELEPLGVAVVLECRHMCMESRGISQQGSTTVTSSMKGVFLGDGNVRQEFMGLIK